MPEELTRIVVLNKLLSRHGSPLSDEDVTQLARYDKLSPRGRRDDIPHPADGSSTRGGSTSVRGRVRSPHMAKLQAASVPVA